MLPTATLTEGHDTHDRRVRLGDLDGDGYRVRYIDPSGLAHASHYEAEYDQLEGVVVEQYIRWRLGQGPRPDPFALAEELVSPENRDDALVDAANALRFWLRLREARGMTFPGHLPDGVDSSGRWSYMPIRN